MSIRRPYRWGGSAYVEISASLALGETSSTAFRGDYGKVAYDHAQAKGSEFATGFYKITTNAEGHVTSATAVTKGDITALGIPAQDTTYADATTSASGLMSAADKSKLDGLDSALAGKADVGHTHTDATTSASGFMSGADKTKLDALLGIPAGGTTGQILVKTASGYEWQDIPQASPTQCGVVKTVSDEDFKAYMGIS